MYVASTTSPPFARRTAAANPAPAPPHCYPPHQRYADGSSISPPSRPGYRPYPPPAYDEYAAPLTSTPVFHSPHCHASPAASGGAEERERKRRISHSAMERRRRERTNNVIGELKDLIPWLRNEARLQKLEVLEQCVSYIKDLQQNQELQSPSSAPAPLPHSRKRSRTRSGTSELDATPAPDALDSPQSPAEGAPQTMLHPDAADPAIVSTLRPSSDAPSPRSAAHARNESSSSCNLPELVLPSDSPSPSKASSTVSTIPPFGGPLLSNIVETGCDTCPPHVKNSIGFLTS
ncbi:hypothetical protein LPJ81_000943 [Coemansia sp. IMI 209127]|nr:hypothetical protein LPJ81_000943 [Coemansia sp. IMI 209127]